MTYDIAAQDSLMNLFGSNKCGHFRYYCKILSLDSSPVIGIDPDAYERSHRV